MVYISLSSHIFNSLLVEIQRLVQVTQSQISRKDRARDSIKCDVEKQKLKKNEMSDDSDDNFEVIY